MRTIREQQGLTAIGTIAVVILVAFIVLTVLRLAPVYLEYFSVVSSLNSLGDDPDLGQKSKAQIHQMIERRFDINDVKHVAKDNIKITQARSKTTVAATYEVRVPMLGNIDFLVSFDKMVEFP